MFMTNEAAGSPSSIWRPHIEAARRRQRVGRLLASAGGRFDGQTILSGERTGLSGQDVALRLPRVGLPLDASAIDFQPPRLEPYCCIVMRKVRKILSAHFAGRSLAGISFRIDV